MGYPRTDEYSSRPERQLSEIGSANRKSSQRIIGKNLQKNPAEINRILVKWNAPLAGYLYR